MCRQLRAWGPLQWPLNEKVARSPVMNQWDSYTFDQRGNTSMIYSIDLCSREGVNKLTV